MNKTIFTLLLSFFTVAAGAKISSGDYIYTLDGKYQILDATNLVTNGDFTGLTTDGWTLSDGTSDVINVNIEDATIDGTATKVVTGTSSFDMFQKVAVSSGTMYLVTYKVKAPDGSSGSTILSTSGVSGGSDIHNVYYNADGSASDFYRDAVPDGTTVINWRYDYTDEWTTKNFAYTATADGYIVIDLRTVNSGVSFADFGIYKVAQVGDERLISDYLDYLDSLLANFGSDAAMIEEINEAKTTLTEMLTDPATNFPTEEVVSEYLNGMDDQVLTPFMNANTVDISSKFMTNSIMNSSYHSATLSGWVINDTAVGSGSARQRGGAVTDADGNYTNNIWEFAYYGGRNYDIPEGSISQSVDLPSGRYMAQFDIDAHVNSPWVSSYDAVREHNIDSVYIFINNQKTACPITDGTLMTTFTAYGDVDSDGLIYVGVWFPGFTASQAAYVCVNNCKFYALTTDSLKVDKYQYQSQLDEARASLLSEIEEATTYYSMTNYKLQKPELKEAIDIAQTIYDTVTDATYDNVTAVGTATTTLTSALSKYTNANANLLTLESDLASANSLYDDATRSKGKDELKTVIDAAQTFYDGISYPEVMPCSAEDSAALKTQDQEILRQDTLIKNAMETCYIANASETTKAVINITALKYTGSGAYNGWTVDATSGNGAWTKNSKSDTRFEDGFAMIYNRGYIATDTKYIYLDYPAPLKGYYQFSMEGYVNREGYSYAIADSSNSSDWQGGWLFFADPNTDFPSNGEGLIDSTFWNNPDDDIERFYVTRSAEIQAEETLRFGFTTHHTSNGYISANHIYIGSPRLYYMGTDAPTNSIAVAEIIDMTTGRQGVYTLSGQKVNSSTLPKGIYIINGHKTAVR